MNNNKIIINTSNVCFNLYIDTDSVSKTRSSGCLSSFVYQLTCRDNASSKYASRNAESQPLSDNNK